MPYAVTLKCLNATGAAIRALWEEAARFEDAPSMRALGYPPHLTLGLYEVEDPAPLIALVEGGLASCPPLTIPFTGIGHFDGPPMVLWAAPAESDALRSLHRAVHRAIDAAVSEPLYRPDSWVPHCTLAMSVAEARRASALDWARRRREPFSVSFDALDCVRFYPVEVLTERRLY